MNATKRTTEDKLAAKSAKAHHKQFMKNFGPWARDEKRSLQLHTINAMKKAKFNVKFSIL